MTYRIMTIGKSILLVATLSLIGALAACGGSSHNSGGGTTTPTISLSTPPTSLAIGKITSITATITNDTSGANWSATCGSTTANACGTFSPTNTASGTPVTYTAPAAVPPSAVTITATVADDASVSQSTAPITITSSTAITVALTAPLPPASLAINGTAPLVATVTNDTANAGVAWTVSCGTSTVCGSFSPASTASAAQTTYTAPAAVPTGNTVTVTAASVTDPTATATATIVITNPPSGLTVGSTYVFSLSGLDANGSYAVAGAFTVGANGTITQGEQDFVDVSATTEIAEYFTDNISSSSSYAFSTDGNLILTLVTCDGTNCSATDSNLGVGGTETVDATLISSSSALVTEFDTSATSTGTLELQNTTAGLAGGYEFFLAGEDPDGNAIADGVPTTLGGILNFNSGTLSTTDSVFDINDPSYASAFTGLTFSSGGVSASPDSFGRVAITLNPASTIQQIQLIGYEVDVNHLRLVETADTYGGVTGGVALGQTGTFTNATISGSSYVFDADGADIANGPLQAAGVIAFTGTSGSSTSGTVSGTVSYNDGTLLNAPGGTAFSGTYTLDATNPGRITISNFTDGVTFSFNFQLYLNGSGYGSLISVDSDDLLAGRVYLQSGTYSAATFSGAYAVAARQVVTSDSDFPQDGNGLITADGIDILAGFLDLNESTPTPDVALTGNFVASSTGVFTGTVSGISSSGASSDNFTFYLVDDTKAVAIESDTDQLTLGYFSLQQ